VVVPFVSYFDWALSLSVIGQQILFRSGEGLNVSFRVDRSLSSTPDTARFEIENLDPDRASLMNRAFSELGTSAPEVTTVTARAGYKDVLGGLFKGNLRSFRTQVQRRSSVWSVAEADDGGDVFTDVQLRLPPTIASAASTMITAAASAMSLTLSPSVGAVLSTSIYANTPFTSTGSSSAAELLDAAARRLRARWWIRDGQVHMAQRGVVDPTRPSVVISERILVGPAEEDGSGIFRLRVFMDPNVVPGGQVTFRATALRVEHVVHSGETRGTSPWTSVITGRVL